MLNLKLETFKAYGGARGPICALCSVSDLLMLDLDHVHGKKDHLYHNNTHTPKNRIRGKKLYRYLSKRNFPDKNKYRVLCKNHNVTEHFKLENTRKQNMSKQDKNYEYKEPHLAAGRVVGVAIKCIKDFDTVWERAVKQGKVLDVIQAPVAAGHSGGWKKRGSLSEIKGLKGLFPATSSMLRFLKCPNSLYDEVAAIINSHRSNKKASLGRTYPTKADNSDILLAKLKEMEANMNTNFSSVLSHITDLKSQAPAQTVEVSK